MEKILTLLYYWFFHPRTGSISCVTNWEIVRMNRKKLSKNYVIQITIIIGFTRLTSRIIHKSYIQPLCWLRINSGLVAGILLQGIY